MKVVEMEGKKYLVWGVHELAFSVRTHFDCPIFDASGEKIGVVTATKRAGSMELPESARYFVKRYFTNSGYPRHTIYLLPTMEVVGEVDGTTTLADVLEMNIPEGVKRFLIRDCRL